LRKIDVAHDVLSNRLCNGLWNMETIPEERRVQFIDDLEGRIGNGETFRA